jgi:L-threonylcarbamoyladenylate synthase
MHDATGAHPVRRMTMDDIDVAEVVANVLLTGGVAVVPTDTVYGIAAHPERPGAVARLFAVKNRPYDVPLPVLVADRPQLRALGVFVTHEAEALMNAFWPGALTLAFGFSPSMPRASWLYGREEVATRLPDSSLLQSILALTGPLLCTSANQHGERTAIDATQVVHSLAGDIDIAVDGGFLREIPSTLVNVRLTPPILERIGTIKLNELRVAVASVEPTKEGE